LQTMPNEQFKVYQGEEGDEAVAKGHCGMQSNKWQFKSDLKIMPKTNNITCYTHTHTHTHSQSHTHINRHPQIHIHTYSEPLAMSAYLFNQHSTVGLVRFFFCRYAFKPNKVRRLIFATFYQFNYFNLSVSSSNNSSNNDNDSSNRQFQFQMRPTHTHTCTYTRTHSEAFTSILSESCPSFSHPSPSLSCVFLLAKMRAICASINALISACLPCCCCCCCCCC